MDINNLLLQGLLVIMTAVAFTASMTCNKMIAKNSQTTDEVFKDNNDIMEMGRYLVKTKRKTSSNSVRNFMAKLNGASEIELNNKSFTAVLQPSDLKKVNKCVYAYV